MYLQAEQLQRRRRQEHEGGSRGPAVRGRGRGEEGARVEIWIRPSGQAASSSSQRGGSESSRDSEQDGELGSLSASDVRCLSLFYLLIHTTLTSRHTFLSFLFYNLFNRSFLCFFTACCWHVLLDEMFCRLCQFQQPFSLFPSTHIVQIPQVLFNCDVIPELFLVLLQ